MADAGLDARCPFCHYWRANLATRFRHRPRTNRRADLDRRRISSRETERSGAFRRIAAPLALLLLVGSAALSGGCAQFQELSLNRASVSDFARVPRIDIEGRIMTLDLGEPIRKPVRACRPMVHRRGLVLLMEARYTRDSNLPTLWTFDLSRLAFDEAEIPLMQIFWIEPDGSHQPMKAETAMTENGEIRS